MSNGISKLAPKSRILVVDDTPANLRLLTKLLNDQGYIVHAANGGEPVFLFLQTTLPDLILLDIRMPDIDGFEVCERLKADASTCDIPVIFISAADEASEKVRAFASGGVDYVVKPFQEQEVLARVQTHLTLRELQRRLASQNEELRDDRVKLLQAAAEKRNLMSEQQSIFDNVGVGIAFFKERRIVRCNQMFASMFRYRPDELIGMPPGLLNLTENIHSAEDSSTSSDFESSAVLAHDAQYQRRDGTVFWAHTTVTAVDRSDPSKGVILVVHDIDQRKRAEERINHLAHYDDLTRLPKRGLLMERIASAIAVASRQHNQFALAFLDLDRFKTINDTLGHDAGDVLLREVATRLLDCVRESDTVARLGGDEFIVLLHDKFTEDVILPYVQRIMERIVRRIAQPVRLAGVEHTVTCSIGIGIYPQDGKSADTLLKNADAAMYRAKEIGRNRFQFFAPEMNARLNERLLLEADMTQALQRQDFELYYQPRLDLRSGHIIGCEALIRWSHPIQGALPPARVIAAAEESNLIMPLGAWMIRQACVQAKAWIDAGLPPIPVAVKLSGTQFDRQDVFALVKQILAETGALPSMLELELTEWLAMQNPQKTAEFLSRLKTLGVGATIGEFGTGFSNLNCLKKLPIDKLKLDRSFIPGVEHSAEDAAVCSAIIEMGHGLHLKVIAEGVEQETQLAILKTSGCDQVQADAFSPPLSGNEFADLVRSERRLGWSDKGVRI